MTSEMKKVEIKNAEDVLFVVDGLISLAGKENAYIILETLLLGYVSSDVQNIPLLEDKFKKGEEMLKDFSERTLKQYREKRKDVEEDIAIIQAEGATKN